MYFNTTPYFTSHGVEPRGRGGWMFQTEDDYRADQTARTYRWDTVHTFCGTYTEARRQARAFFPKGSAVVVMP